MEQEGYFKVRHRYLELLEPLSQAARGRLFTALLTYSAGGQPPALPGKERQLFLALRGELDRDRAEAEGRAGSFRRAVLPPPTEAEAADYCRRERLEVDPAEFVDYYAARGWRYAGGGLVEDWQAALRAWDRRGRQRRRERFQTGNPFLELLEEAKGHGS